MPLRLYNTLSRIKEDFAPFDPRNVRMYVCGPTVYDFAHIGNARPVIVFDVLFRLLRHLYGEDHVTYVRNITDIDDKINARALERRDGREVPILDVVRTLTAETSRAFAEDVSALGCLPPTYTPRATEHIADMIAMIETLIAAGHAYEAQGHVLFDVSSKADYGKLARRSPDEMMAGARVEVAPYKRGTMDFVLWKPSDADTPGWESPWGRGRPGWHIECSAMSAAYLGETFDIHGGGIDLVFPHHENEIAQSEAAHHGHPLARIWMHNGFLNVEGEKMSKSLGNFVTIRELLADWPGEVLRFNMLRSHYRQPIDWTLNSMIDSDNELNRWYPVAKMGAANQTLVSTPFIDALFDDLNTPEAVTVMRELFSKAHAGDPRSASELASAGSLLGLFSASLQTFVRERSEKLKRKLDLGDERIAQLIDARNTARKAKNFKEADRIRDELGAKGIVLKDSPSGTSWEIKR